jgi:hypothetical protein
MPDVSIFHTSASSVGIMVSSSRCFWVVGLLSLFISRSPVMTPPAADLNTTYLGTAQWCRNNERQRHLASNKVRRHVFAHWYSLLLHSIRVECYCT